ncbi:hypothetical protein N7450_001173 [Penicillium hetheringtonii]|uniref:Fungal N-terminal domain-containing protein n=1 Tax=Penicillium hetheringtonii TaxID=911720 RepID=A0AAD6H2F3_9EURO|nr:hypothetical protein N7450_001173 [Penicillium hetheringtonii]
MASTSFGDSNSGFQVGNNNGSIEAQFHVTAERSKLYNTQGGAVFNVNLTANRDINIHNIVTIQPLAQSLYKSLFNSSDLFAQVRNELGLLVSVLNLTQEHTPKFQPDDPRLSELDDARDKCHDALRELVQLKDHFDDVGPQSQVTWERLGWGVEELVEIRTKLSIYIQALNVINCSISRSSIENVERMLKTFISEIRIGKRESAAMSSASNGSLTADERETWRQLRKELRDIGITPEIFAQHRGFILVSLQTLLTEEEREDYPVNLETPGSALEESTSERLPGATTRASKMAIGEDPGHSLQTHRQFVTR